jgi:parvulin-like peptidyl-prolyl isomerase
MNSITSRGLLVVATAVFVVVGCARHPEPVIPRLTTGGRTQKPMAADPMSGADQPGALYDNVRVELTPAERELRDRAAHEPVEGLSKTVQENVTAPGATTTASTQPAANGGAAAATAPGTATGEFFTIGGVVAEVNGVPIYANKVLNLVEPVLAAQAKEMDAQRFKAVASNEIKQQMFALRNLELEYAAAERNLDQKDKDLADLLTQQWRQRQITQAGGSIELARKNAPEIARRERLNPNASFDELCSEMYRVIMSRVYYEKKVMPRIQVSAAEMREYYDRNRDTLFTERGVAQLRLIKVDVAKAGGRDAAFAKINTLRNRIVKAGEPFESIARSVNDNPLLLKTGGQVKVDQGAFAVKQVDDAVWRTPEGQVTDVIDAGDAFYIAQVLEKKPGNVQSFDDEAVQQRISDDLRARDFREMRKKVQEQLEQDAVIRSDPQMMNTAIEMAMQNYPRWARK